MTVRRCSAMFLFSRQISSVISIANGTALCSSVLVNTHSRLS
uniref:Uncharacterized protein n=1 Tax=Anguilla anguilla TaxID=7936 RepID=A0A0E9Q3T9_ANGAN